MFIAFAYPTQAQTTEKELQDFKYGSLKESVDRLAVSVDKLRDELAEANKLERRVLATEKDIVAIQKSLDTIYWLIRGIVMGIILAVIGVLVKKFSSDASEKHYYKERKPWEDRTQKEEGSEFRFPKER